MKNGIEAIYEHGVFKPLKHPGLTEKQHVRLSIEVLSQETAGEMLPMLELASQVYEGLSGRDVDEVERIALNRREFFGEKGSP